MKKITLALLTALFFTACAKDSNDKAGSVAVVPPAQYEAQQGRPQGQGQNPYAYEYAGDNCTTGRQRFVNRDQYCGALRNDGRNNNCAVQPRYEAFGQYCPGHRWQR